MKITDICKNVSFINTNLKEFAQRIQITNDKLKRILNIIYSQ